MKHCWERGSRNLERAKKNRRKLREKIGRLGFSMNAACDQQSSTSVNMLQSDSEIINSLSFTSHSPGGLIVCVFNGFFHKMEMVIPYLPRCLGQLPTPQPVCESAHPSDTTFRCQCPLYVHGQYDLSKMKETVELSHVSILHSTHSHLLTYQHPGCLLPALPPYAHCTQLPE